MTQRLLWLILLATLGANASAVEWLTDLPSALTRAQQENKTVLVDFTGSDWCPWCQKLKAEVFDQPDFATYAAANLVLVEVDFPHHKALTTEQHNANRAVASKYGVHGYPTVLLLGSDGRVRGRSGYVRGGPPAFLADIERFRTRLRPGESPPEAPAPSGPKGLDRSGRSPKAKPAPVVLVDPPPLKYGALTLKGISGVGSQRLALINNQSLMAGETAKVRSFGTNVDVSVKEIRDASVLIVVNGQSRELALPHSQEKR